MNSATVRNEPSELDRVFSALGSPVRRAIVRRLADADATVTQLAAPFDMSLPAVSKHLAVLEEAGMVHRRKIGRSTRCSLRTGAVREAESWLADCRSFWEGSLDSLEEHLDREQTDRSGVGGTDANGRAESSGASHDEGQQR